MEVKAKLRYARITARKMRLVAGLCKGMPVEKASYQLRFSPKRGAKVMSGLLDSAVSNAKEKGGIDVDNLYVKNILVDTGPMLKRFIPRSQGRATPVLKRMCHVPMILDEAK